MKRLKNSFIFFLMIMSSTITRGNLEIQWNTPIETIKEYLATNGANKLYEKTNGEYLIIDIMNQWNRTYRREEMGFSVSSSGEPKMREYIIKLLQQSPIEKLKKTRVLQAAIKIKDPELVELIVKKHSKILIDIDPFVSHGNKEINFIIKKYIPIKNFFIKNEKEKDRIDSIFEAYLSENSPPPWNWNNFLTILKIRPELSQFINSQGLTIYHKIILYLYYNSKLTRGLSDVYSNLAATLDNTKPIQNLIEISKHGLNVKAKPIKLKTPSDAKYDDLKELEDAISTGKAFTPQELAKTLGLNIEANILAPFGDENEQAILNLTNLSKSLHKLSQ